MVRWAAALALAKRGDDQVAAQLQGWLQGDDARLKAAALDALGPLADSETLRDWLPWLGDSHLDLRHALVRALANRGGEEHLSQLIVLVEDRAEEVAVRRAALEAICRIMARTKGESPPELESALLALLSDPSPVLRAGGAKAIGELGLLSFEEGLCALLADPDPGVRYRTVRSLSRVGQGGSLAPLRRLLRDRRRVLGRSLSAQARWATARIAFREAFAGLGDRLADLFGGREDQKA